MSDIGGFVRPEATELSAVSGLAALRPDVEQQQQQQQQQQQSARVRRFLNTDTMLPQEEVTTKLTTEIRQLNVLSPREGV